MDKKIIAQEEANSLFQVDRMFLNKILARKSFVEKSKQTLDAENVVSVPFDWEMFPGTPKHRETEIVPPVRPPPALQSLSLDKPRFAPTHTTIHCFGKKSRKSHHHRQSKHKLGKPKAHERNFQGDDSPEVVEFSIDSVSPSDHSRSSSSSSFSNSSSNSTGSSSSRVRTFAKEQGIIYHSCLMKL